MIFQDPYSSLNPRHTVGTIVGAPLRVQHVQTEHGVKRAVQELLELVGLNPEHYNRYPHEFSGGQRQRIGIARTLALRAQADRRGRAGLRARRLDPGPGHQPARRPAGRARPQLRDHRPRPRGGPPHQRPGRGHVPRQDRGAGRPRRPVRAAAGTRTRWRCCRRSRCPSRWRRRRAAGCAGSGSGCPATCRARSTRRPAAGSTPAAGRRRTSARPASRRWSRWPRHRAACHFPENTVEQRTAGRLAAVRRSRVLRRPRSATRSR